MTSHSIELSLDSELLNLDLVGGAVGGIATVLGFGETERYHLELCAVEAVSNSIRHAYGEPGHPVRVRVSVDEERIELRVFDQGTPVPLERRVRPSLPDPESLDGPADLSEGGRGIFLMFTLMDEVAFGVADGWNFVALTKRRSEA